MGWGWMGSRSGARATPSAKSARSKGLGQPSMLHGVRKGSHESRQLGVGTAAAAASRLHLVLVLELRIVQTRNGGKLIPDDHLHRHVLFFKPVHFILHGLNVVEKRKE